MKKINVIITAIVAVLAFSAIAASSALAVSKILLNNAEIAAKIPFLVAPLTGTALLLEDMGLGVDILCEGFFDGSIEPKGELGFIEQILMADGTLLEETILSTIKGNDIECEAHSTCTNPTLLVALNLPWHIEVNLERAAEYRLHILEEAGKSPEYYLDCNVPLIGLTEDYCGGLTMAAVTGVENSGLIVEFSENSEITPSVHCTASGGEGLLFGVGLMTSTEGSLSVSE